MIEFEQRRRFPQERAYPQEENSLVDVTIGNTSGFSPRKIVDALGGIVACGQSGVYLPELKLTLSLGKQPCLTVAYDRRKNIGDEMRISLDQTLVLVEQRSQEGTGKVLFIWPDIAFAASAWENSWARWIAISQGQVVPNMKLTQITDANDPYLVKAVQAIYKEQDLRAPRFLNRSSDCATIQGTDVKI